MATLQNIGVLKYRDKNGKWQPLPVVLQGAGGAGGVTTISGNGVPNTSTVGRVNQLYRDEATDKLYICTGTDGAYTWAAVVSDTEDAVKYTGQTLTNVQKAQARANIGAGTSNFSGAYNDLTGKPNIPAAAVIDTTLTKAGQAADAKAVGDKITEVNGKVEDKLDATALPTAVNNALAQAKASGAFDGAKGEKGDPGEDGQAGTPGQNGVSPHIGTNGNWWIGTTDTGVSATGGSYTLPVATPDALGGVKPIGKTAAMTQDVGVDADGKLYTAPSGGGTDKSLGITSATVGQIAKITAVDVSGKPTGWEPVDIPSGGEGTWELINEITFEDAANVVTISTDANGNAFSLRRAKVECILLVDESDPLTWIKILPNGVQVSNNTSSKTTSGTTYYSVYLEWMGVAGIMSATTDVSQFNYNWGYNVQKMGYRYNNDWAQDSITSIKIAANDGRKAIGVAGTKIIIYGVKK